jgi:integrase
MEDRPLLTDDLVREVLKDGGHLPNVVYDGADGVTGFGIRRKDRKWVLNYTARMTGIERRYPIGQFPMWKVERARKRAIELRIAIDQGADPMADERDARSAPTVADLVARFREDHLPAKRPKTAEAYERQLTKYILPAIGHLRVDDVAFEHADALHRQITKAGHKTMANRVNVLGHRLFVTAIRLRMRTDGQNPFKHVAANREHPRFRYLSHDELERLLAAMARHPDIASVRAIKLLLLCGSRRGETLAMRWCDVDLDQRTWSKPATSVKQGRAHHVPLNGPTCTLLAEIMAEQTAGRKPLPTYVFTGSGARGHLVEIKRTWRRLTRDAQLENFRLHDLRHAHASFLASGGSSLLVIGQLLGHSSAASTKRYSHLLDSPLRDASERVGALIAAAETSMTPADVVPIRRKKG